MNNKIIIDFEEYKELQKIAIESTKIVDLEARIDKAIELLEEHQNNLYSKSARKLMLDDYIEIALNILRGEDDENSK